MDRGTAEGDSEAGEDLRIPGAERRPLWIGPGRQAGGSCNRD